MYRVIFPGFLLICFDMFNIRKASNFIEVVSEQNIIELYKSRIEVETI